MQGKINGKVRNCAVPLRVLLRSLDMVAAEEKKMQGKQTHSAHGRRDGKKGSQNGQHERKERDDQGHRQESDSAKGARKPDATNSH